MGKTLYILLIISSYNKRQKTTNKITPYSVRNYSNNTNDTWSY